MTTETAADPADMYTVHDVFRREIGLEPDLVRAVPAGDVARAETIARHIDLVHGLLHHHHTGEDKHVWPKLHERGTTDVDGIVHVMETQHQHIEKPSDSPNGARAPIRNWARRSPARWRNCRGYCANT
jgi:hypothetical protein